MKSIVLKSTDKFPYRTTEVSIERSIAETKTLLMKFGCEQMAELTETTDEGHLVSRLMFIHRGTPFIIDFPLVYVQSMSTKKKVQRQDIAGRIVFNRIKALLIDAEIGFLSFEEALASHRALKSPEGNWTSIQDVVTQIQSPTDVRRMLTG